MKFHFGLCCLLAALLDPCAAEELLISGGPIYTGDAKHPRVESLLIRGEKIVFAGALEQARRQAIDARPINLQGGAAYPGFVDSHAHLTGIGLREMELNLDQVASIEALATALKDWAKAHPGTDPITGRGWIETHWPEKRFPTRADIDRAVSDRPVFLERADGHAAIANSRRMPARVWKRVLTGLLEFQPRPPRPRVRTLVLGGREDAVFSALEQTALARQFPDGRLQLVEHVGHALHWEQPQTFVDALLRFAR